MLTEQRLEDMNVVLPGNPHRPAGSESPFQWAAIHGGRVSVSGHEPLVPDGRPPSRLGRVPTEVSLEHAQSSARLAALDMLASLKSVLGDLDRVVSWLTVVSFVNADPDYASIDLVMSPVSDLILALYGPEVGRHERRAVAVSAAPLDLPVAIVAEVEIRN
jgi:enamine deaminase RidA (YjgF/YER057c/UK114 family)